MKKEGANAKHIWYIVTLPTDVAEKETPICNTTATTTPSCILSLPPGIRKAFIWAQNTVGTSPKKEIIFFATSGKELLQTSKKPNKNIFSLN